MDGLRFARRVSVYDWGEVLMKDDQMTNEALAQRLPDGLSVDEFRKVINEAHARIAIGTLDLKVANQALYDTCKRLLTDPQPTT